MLLACIACTALASPSLAEELTGTLKKIKDSGSIVLGHRESSIPFAYYDDKQQVVGYSIEIVYKIVDAVKKQLNMPNLQVKLNPVTSQTRIPLLQNGTIDLECGSTTNNLERQQQISFSDTIFLIGTRLLTKKNSGIKDFPDLAGKTVVTTAGTTSERLIRKMNEEKKMNMNIISAKDHGESFLMVESGRAVAFMMDDDLRAGEMAKEGMTMMCVTHEMGFERKAAHRVIFMDQGGIVEDDAKDEFFGTPRSERAQQFLSKILHH